MQKMQYEIFLPKDVFWTLDEIVSEYGLACQRNFANSLVIKNEDLYNSYKNEDLISITIQDNKKDISKKLIHDILSQEGMYKYLQTNLDNHLGIAIRLDYIIDKDTFLSIKITRAELIEALNNLSSELTQKEKMRSAVIKNSLHLFSCQQKYRNYIHTCFIENNEVNIPASTLISILTMDDARFASFLAGKINYEYKKEHLAYALVDFVERERIFNKYVLPENFYKRYNAIKNYSLIDFESINKNRIKNDITEEGESILDKVEISSELMAKLDEQKENNYSELELAIYYYLQLCEILTFSNDYYFTKNLDISSTELDKICSITPDNNQVTTYEFLLLFAKILSNLNIDFTFDQTIFAGILNGTHKLTFKYGEYLVALNSLDNIGESDLTNVKVNDNLSNLICTNKNEVTRKKFMELTEKIYNDIIAKKANQEAFKQAVNRYKDTFEYSKTTVRDKLYLLLKALGRTNLKGLQILSYEKKVFANLFKDNPNININFVCTLDEDSNYIRPITIVSILDSGEYKYFIVDGTKDNKIDYLNHEELIELFETKSYLYLHDKKIPGIEPSVGEMYAR